MTTAETIGEALKVVSGVITLLQQHQQKLIELQAKVVAHDAALQHATLNPPKLT